jgi:hypothetical protein
MPPTSVPYYSIDPREVVYHNNLQCPAGNSIPLHNLRYGQPAGRRLCEDCLLGTLKSKLSS